MTCLSLLGLAVGVIVAVLYGVWLALVVRQKVVAARYTRQFRGKWLLVCSSRHDWYDFIKNNVEPALPRMVCIAWTGRMNRDTNHDDPAAILRTLGATGERPFLFQVDSRKVVSVHDELRELRSSDKRDPLIQQRVRELLSGIVGGA